MLSGPMLDMTNDAEVGVWCSMPPALSTQPIAVRPPKIHVHVRPEAGGKKIVDRDFNAIAIQYGGGLFRNVEITQVNVTPPAAFEFVRSLEIGRELDCINCSHCGYPHLDLDDFRPALTGYNSTYSDRPFEKKKSIKGGFSESSVRLNKFVREQEKWTAQEMSRRGKELAKRALSIWPNLTVEQSLVDAENQIEMKERAQRRDVTKVPMTPAARHSFEQLRQRIQTLDSEIFELAEQKSVSYHGPTFFLEVIPRKNGLGLLLALDFNEVEEPPSIVRDAAQSKFIVHASYDAGVYARIKSDADIEKIFPLIRKAYELAKA